MEGMIVAAEYVIAKLPADVKVIPGHGAISNLDDVRRFVAMLKETRAVVEKAIKAGKTLDQMKQEKILEPGRSGRANLSPQTPLSKRSTTT